MPGTAALSSIVPEIWAARFLSFLDKNNIYKALANRNYEGEIRAAGDTVKIPTFTGAVTVRDYVVNTDIASPEIAAATTQDFVITQQKYFNIYVDDIDRVQSRPALMDEYIRRGAVGIAETMNTYVGEKFYNATPVAARQTSVGSSAAKLMGGTAALRTTAAQDIIRALSTLKKQITNNNLREQTWLVIHPDLHEAIEQYLSVNTSLDYGGQTSNVLSAGFAGNLVGFNVIVDPNIPIGTGGNEDRYRCIAGTNAAVTYADQIAQVIPYRPEARFGDAVKALYVYDAALVDAKYLYHFDVWYDIDGS